MKENKNIEDLLKDHLNKEFDFNNSDLDELSSILDEYNEEPKRKKGAFFIAAGILFLLGMLAVLIFNKTKINTENLLVENTEIIENKKFNNSYNKKVNNSNERELECFDSENEFIEETKRKKTSKQAIIKETVSKLNIVEKTQKTNKSIITLKEEKQKTTSKFGINIKNKNSKIGNKTLKNSTVPSQVTNKVDSALGIENLSETKQKTANSQIIDSNLSKNESTNKNDSSPIENISENKIIILEDLLNKNIIEILSNEKSQDSDSLEYLNKTIIDSLEEKKESIIVEVLPIKKKLGISIALKAGVSFLNRQFNSENIKRNTEESNITTWNTSLELSKTIKNKFLIVTGINLVNYGENIDYTPINYIKRDTTYSLVTNTYGLYTYSKANGVFYIDTTTIELEDTLFVINEQELKDESVSIENGLTKFRYIEIPFQLGYKFLNKNKFSLSGMTGVSIGLLTNSKGFYIDNENVLQKAESNKIIFNYLLSLEFRYNIFNNIHICLSPHFKQNLNNLSNLNKVERKYSTFGINAGVGIDF